MKKLLLGIFSVTLLLSATEIATAGGKGKLYGKEFSTAKATKPEDLSKTMGGKTTMENVVLEGTIAQVCQAEGCWLKLKNTAGQDILIKFKDHAFLVPKDIAGKTAVINGTAVKKVVSVEEQKHMAEDAGSSPSDIAAITAPKEELRVEATGVVVK
jgi:hypothetical protein